MQQVAGGPKTKRIYIFYVYCFVIDSRRMRSGTPFSHPTHPSACTPQAPFVCHLLSQEKANVNRAFGQQTEVHFVTVATSGG